MTNCGPNLKFIFQSIVSHDFSFLVPLAIAILVFFTFVFVSFKKFPLGGRATPPEPIHTTALCRAPVGEGKRLGC